MKKKKQEKPEKYEKYKRKRRVTLWLGKILQYIQGVRQPQRPSPTYKNITPPPSRELRAEWR